VSPSNATRIYTRTGDDGSTGLGTGRRVPKEHPRVAAYGTVDELNSHLGVVLASDVDADLREPLVRVQNLLFDLGSGLCMLPEDKQKYPVPEVEAQHVAELEQLMDRLSKSLPPLGSFILPGGHPAAAQLHVARCVCRRAERLVVALSRDEPLGDHDAAFLNRLSDALFVMARYQNARAGIEDVKWLGRKRPT
jgi:cob(I)alamin adenosyltransferase